MRLPVIDRASAPSLPYPRGWYVVAESDDLPRGAVKPLRAFGRDLVVFRTDGGEAQVVNAYCPHLGAHLGHGGTVVGERIRCPFHGWQFDGRSGKCVKAAHGDAPPSRAAIKRWHVDEKDGVVLVWYHDADESPTWHVQPQPDFDLEWTPWRRRVWEFKARIQDVAENDADASHSPAMHGLTDDLPELAMEVDGPNCTWIMKLLARREAFGIPEVPWLWNKLGIPTHIPSDVTVLRSGFSIGLIRQSSELPGGFTIRSQTFITTTPIDDEQVRVVARHRVAPTPFRPLTKLVLDKYAYTFDSTFEEDIQIWENKIYRMRPMASKTDWSVMQLRQWARQFYDDDVYEAALHYEDELRRAGNLP